MDIKRVLKEHAYQNIPLWYDQAYELGCYALEGCAGNQLAMLQSITALSALHTKATYAHVGHDSSTPSSAAEQIAGICAAIFTEDIARSKFGFARPNVPFVMDNCGMGGDLVVTANVSTLAGLTAATAGINICKHGSPANADGGRHGSSDFISLCGIDPFIDRATLEQMVELCSFGYSEALDERFKRIHKQTHGVAFLPHMNDIIGPITNPVDPSLMRRRVIGVNHLVSPRVVAQAYQILNQKGVTNVEHLFAVRGHVSNTSGAGVDELSICEAGTEVAELKEGSITEYRVAAEDLGLHPVSPASISPSEGESKGEFSLRILHGEETGAAFEMVLANAALLFVLNDPSIDIKKAYDAAYDTFRTGTVPRTIDHVRALLAQKMQAVPAV